MEYFINFVQEWGYLAVFLGSIVEGESVILTASSMAYFGHLSLIKIMLIAFTTTTIVDQILFFIGRHYGPSLIDRYPHFKAPADRAFKLLHRFDFWFILSFRFIYGIRVISPVVIGAGGVSPSRFIPLNIISAITWTLTSCIGGYMLGSYMMNILDNIHVIQKYFFAGLLIIAIGVYFYWRRKKKK